jgi:ribonuclease HI
VTIIAAADGSALGNPGPAGWGWYVSGDCWASGGWAHGTNNMGELMAVLDLLQQSAHLDEELHIICDSRYVIDSITKWMPGWKRNGWLKKDRKPVLNVELMKALDAAMQGRRVKFEWVKGHTGHHLNEEADRLANAAAVAHREGREPEPGPGFEGASTNHPAAQVGQVVAEPDLFSDLEPELSDEEQVVSLERSLLTDDVRSDRAAVAALLHPQWQEVGSSGVLWDRETVLDRIDALAAPASLEVISMSRLTSDLILIVWRESADDGSRLRSSLWQRSGGQWQQRFHQGTFEA